MTRCLILQSESSCWCNGLRQEFVILYDSATDKPHCYTYMHAFFECEDVWRNRRREERTKRTNPMKMEERERAFSEV